ncbi:MAG: TolC family protein, partial [Muribaculaceae bacterium]|nr:TolC family protein [Muribaculaceae bacterium]
MRIISHIIICCTAALMMLCSCSGIKKCRAPELNLPSVIMPGATDSTTLADIKWWNLYADTTLCALIDRALTNNKDILSAMAKVEESRVLYGVAKSNQLPELSYNIYGNNETNDYSGEGSTSDTEIGAKVNLNWEIDFWGRLKWARKKGEYEFLSSVEALRAAEIILIAEVADTYFRLMALD